MSKINKGEISSTPIKKQKIDLKDLGLLSRTLNGCNNCYNENFEADNLDLLDLEAEVVQMIRNYRNNQYQRITNAATSVNPITNDARSVYFSLNKLKSFIYAIEEQCCPCSSDLGELGIRFYYGAYDTTLTEPDGSPHEYAGKHTLVLVPTYTSIVNDNGVNRALHVDFCPDWMDGCTPVSLHQDSVYENNPDVNRQSQLPAIASTTPSKKILALVGGYKDIKKVKVQENKSGKIVKKKSQKTTSKTESKFTSFIPGEPSDPIGTGIIRTLLNHGDLVPPPGVTSSPYQDATLLNCE